MSWMPGTRVANGRARPDGRRRLETIAANVAALAGECAATLGEDDAALLVTSNGILKFFLKLVPGAFEDMAARGALKVATGHCCALRHGARGWEVVFWDREPAQIALA